MHIVCVCVCVCVCCDRILSDFTSVHFLRGSKEEAISRLAQLYIYIYVSPKMRTLPVRELGSQFAN